MKFEIHYHIEFLMRSDRDWVKSSPIPPVNRHGHIAVDEDAVLSDVNAPGTYWGVFKQNSRPANGLQLAA